MTGSRSTRTGGLDGLEPAAFNAPCGVREIEKISLVSIAISLRRIADALSADGIDGLHHTITNMAWEAGRHFTAGTRTDR